MTARFRAGSPARRALRRSLALAIAGITLSCCALPSRAVAPLLDEAVIPASVEATAALPPDLVGRLQIIRGPVRFNAKKKEYSLEVRLRNASDLTLQGPFRATVRAARPGKLSLRKPDGISQEGPYIMFGQDHALAPGGETTARKLVFRGKSDRRSLKFGFSLWVIDSIAAFEVPTNPSDPLLLKALTPDGSVVETFGRRTADGLPASVDFLGIRDPSGSESLFALSEDGRPSQFRAPNGTTIDFNWISPTEVVARVMSAGGEIEVLARVDLGAMKASILRVGAAGAMRALPPAPRRTPRGGVPVTLRATMPRSAAPSQPAVSGSQTARATVKVTRCGGPENQALVRMYVTRLNAKVGEGRFVPCQFLGEGLYGVDLPIEAGHGQTAEAICNALEGILSPVCDFLQLLGPQGTALLCVTIEAAALLIPGAQPLIPALNAGCGALLPAVLLYCATLGGGSPVPGGDSIMKKVVCDHIKGLVDSFRDDDYCLAPEVYLSGRGLVNPAQPMTYAPATGPLPLIEVDIPDDPQGATIENFTIEPADPGPGEGYVAGALIRCAPSGTQVRISVVGTDGYTDSATVTSNGDFYCSLYVPGGEAGVSDVVTVEIIGGRSRSIGLVF